MALELELKNLGFSDKEAQVYLALLELGEAPVQKISEKAKVNRATTYVVLEALQKRGVVSTVEKDTKVVFAAENPRMLNRLFRVQAEELRAKEEEFERTLPELEALFNRASEKPRVRYFEGKEGMLAIREDLLNSKVKKIFEIYSADEVETILTVDEREEFSERREKLDVTVRSIYTRSNGPWKTTFGNQKFLPKDKFPFSSDIIIYGSNVALATLRGKLVGVIVESKEIADTLRLVFELAWRGADRA